jgi:ABC-type branched-subunit amino acid transport system ATPase component
MLKIENLHVSYGGIRALQGVSMEVPDGKIVTLIGANGAGKSTTLRTISGLVKADSGSISYDGQELLAEAITPPEVDGELLNSVRLSVTGYEEELTVRMLNTA